ALTLSRPNHPGTRSAVHKFQVSRSKQKTKTPSLPPLGQARSANKSKMKTSTRVQPVVHSKTTPVGTSQLKNPQELHGREQVQPWKMQAKLRLMRSMLRTQRTSLQELSNHERFLIKLNEELIEAIRCMEDSTALTVRTMVQQHYVLGNVIDILEYSNKKRVQELKTELLEWEELEKLKLKRLEQQLEQLHAENKMTHEEARFLSTYMDHEYPVKSVQIASHMRQLQQAKDDQKDELDNLSEMRKVVLGSLSNMIQEKKKSILRSLMMKTQKPHEKRLLQKTQNSQHTQKYTVWVRGLIDQMRKEIPTLMAEVEEPQAEILETREVVFEDVLLRRPKCTPDMAIDLNIPVEEPLPF
uniref:Uncharacterized protein n=1 Tax=Castor canadensis TaxID=51338 RepID=A0A8C0WHX9_CASCN